MHSNGAIQSETSSNFSWTGLSVALHSLKSLVHKVFVCWDFHWPPADFNFTPNHTFFPSFHRDRPWPSSWELKLTWSAQPSRRRRASTVFSVLRLWPAWTNSSLPTNPAQSADSPRDSYTCPAGQSSSLPPSARTSPRAAPLCEYWTAGENKRGTIL